MVVDCVVDIELVIGVGRSLGTALRGNGVTYSLARVVRGIKGGIASSQVCR